MTSTNDKVIYFGLGIAVAMSMLSMFKDNTTEQMLHDDRQLIVAWASTVKAECGKHGIDLPNLNLEEH